MNQTEILGRSLCDDWIHSCCWKDRKTRKILENVQYNKELNRVKYKEKKPKKPKKRCDYSGELLFYFFQLLYSSLSICEIAIIEERYLPRQTFSLTWFYLHLNLYIIPHPKLYIQLKILDLNLVSSLIIYAKGWYFFGFRSAFFLPSFLFFFCLQKEPDPQEKA